MNNDLEFIEYDLDSMRFGKVTVIDANRETVKENSRLAEKDLNERMSTMTDVVTFDLVTSFGEAVYTLVPAECGNPMKGFISESSLLGKALKNVRNPGIVEYVDNERVKHTIIVKEVRVNGELVKENNRVSVIKNNVAPVNEEDTYIHEVSCKIAEENAMIEEAIANYPEVWYTIYTGFEDFTFRLVPAGCGNPMKGYVSVDSLLGASVNGKQVNDTVSYVDNSGVLREYTIINVVKKDYTRNLK